MMDMGQPRNPKNKHLFFFYIGKKHLLTFQTPCTISEKQIDPNNNNCHTY